MISLRTALCLSGLLVVATGSAALDTPPSSERAATPRSAPATRSEGYVEQVSEARDPVPPAAPRHAGAAADRAETGAATRTVHTDDAR